MLSLLLACTPPPPAAPPVSEVFIDYGALYGGFSSMGLVDWRLAEPSLLARVQLEAGALSTLRPDSSVEPWLRRELLSALSARDATIVGPAPGAPATLLLRDLYFGVSTDTVDVVVRADDGHSDRYQVDIRHFGDEDSLCPEGLSVAVPYIALHATAQRVSDGAVVALWHEVSLPEIDPERAVRAVHTRPERLCEAVAELMARDEALQPTPEEYQRAAAGLVRLALRPFAAADAPSP